LAISVSNLVSAPALQLELPLGLADNPRRPGSASNAARWGADRSVDAIRARFGRQAIGYAGVASGDEGFVPTAFRELGERRLAAE
jgi:DNA polymerase-4